MRWHAQRQPAGTSPVYQGRFKSFPVEADEHLLTLLRYVERNPRRARLVAWEDKWCWSSLGQLCRAGSAVSAVKLAAWPVAPARLGAAGQPAVDRGRKGGAAAVGSAAWSLRG